MYNLFIFSNLLHKQCLSPKTSSVLKKKKIEKDKKTMERLKLILLER